MSNRYTPISTKITWVHQKTPLSPSNLNRLEDEIYGIAEFLKNAQASGMVLGKGTIIGDDSQPTSEDTLLSVNKNQEFSSVKVTEEYVSLLHNLNKGSYAARITEDELQLLSKTHSLDMGVEKLSYTGPIVNINANKHINMGIKNISSVKGFYWRAIDFTNNTIEISKIRTSSSAPSVSNPDDCFDWKKGDTISIICGSKYPFSATIIEDVTSNIIKVDAIPFTEKDMHNAYYTKVAGVWIENTLTGYLTPEERTIFAVSRTYPTEVIISGIRKTINAATITPRNGLIDIQWAATILGVNNINSGTLGLTAGLNNLQAGDFGATFGRDNVGGYATLTSGWNNINRTACSVMFGTGNKNNGKSCQLLSGTNNFITVWNGGAIGRHLNVIHDNSEFVTGQFNAEVTKRPLYIIGNGNVTADPIQDGDEVVDGYKVVRSNAFVVYYDGDAEITKDLLVKRNAVITGTITASGAINSKKVSAGSNNKINAGSSGSAFGDEHTLNNNQCLANGFKNVHNSSCTFSSGSNLEAQSWCQSIFGKFNVPNKNDVLIVGWGSEGARKNIMTLSQSGVLNVTKDITINGKSIVSIIREQLGI